MKPLIAIGLGTRDRPGMLESALKSLIDLKVPDDTEVQLIVCENGPNDTSRELVNTYQEKLPFKTVFLKEETVGITFMRNKILREAIGMEADYLAFFDDDESVDTNWVLKLYETMVNQEAQVVQGSVEMSFPSTTISGLERYFPGFKNRKTGEVLDVAYTNNVLFELALVKEHALNFNNRFNLSGGSDSLFFLQLAEKGAKIVFCDEALVYEEIPESRANLAWLHSRHYRHGYADYLIKEIVKGKIAALLSGLRTVTKAVPRCIINRKSQPLKTIDQLLTRKKCQYAKGTFHAMTGRKFEEYNQIHGY